MNLRELYVPLIYKFIPFYSIFLIFVELFLYKINTIKGDTLLSNSNLVIIAINMAVLFILFVDFSLLSAALKRDVLLFLFMMMGAISLVLFVHNYSFMNIILILCPSLLSLWFLSSPFTTHWARGDLTDKEIYEGFLQSKKLGPAIEKYMSHSFLFLLCSLILIPLLWILDTAFSSGNSLSSSFDITKWSGDHFSNILGSEDFYVWVRNSIIVSVGTTAFGLLMAVPAGYGFSRFNFKGKGAIMFSFILVQMFPGVIIIVPYFILMKTLGLLNTSIGLILAYSVTALPLCVWMLKGYFDTIPRELEEAARVDGCTQFQVFWKIIIPLSLPAIAVTSLFSFLAAWNEFLLALTFNTGNENYTLPVGLASFISPTKQLWGDFAALSIIASIPVVLLFIVFQKYLINGLTAGSVKG